MSIFKSVYVQRFYQINTQKKHVYGWVGDLWPQNLFKIHVIIGRNGSVSTQWFKVQAQHNHKSLSIENKFRDVVLSLRLNQMGVSCMCCYHYDILTNNVIIKQN